MNKYVTDAEAEKLWRVVEAGETDYCGDIGELLATRAALLAEIEKVHRDCGHDDPLECWAELRAFAKQVRGRQ